MPLIGLREYLYNNNHVSIFTQITAADNYELHLHQQFIVQAKVIENLQYEVKLKYENEQQVTIVQKQNIKFLYAREFSTAVLAQLKSDHTVRQMGHSPIQQISQRHHIKNKTLYPLMQEREVLFFTMLEGEILRGIVTGFSRYEINLKLKGGVPVTLFRHGIYDVRNKAGRCFLKKIQEKSRDWQKSQIFQRSE